MTYQVHVLARAQQDLDDILAYVAERSPEGAARLLASFELSPATSEDEGRPYTADNRVELPALGAGLRPRPGF
jgi:plasmid stabilization system protein ParE